MSSNKIAVVTGGASGIGEACARVLAARGATVVIADLRGPLAEQVAGEIGGHAVQLDVTDTDACEAVAERIEREIGPVDHLVTSAGITQGDLVSPEDIAAKRWDLVFRVNVRGTYFCCTSFGKRMVQRRRGSIVTIGSVTALRSTPLHAYGPSKAAVLHLTQNLAAAWGRAGVRVNCITPGYVLTQGLEQLVEKGQRALATMEQASAMGRMVMPDEVATAAAFLLSEDASAITGVSLPVDVGWLLAGSWQTYGGLPDL